MKSYSPESTSDFHAWCMEMYYINKEERLAYKDKPISFDEYMVRSKTFLIQEFKERKLKE